jgi:hypothetical protein
MILIVQRKLVAALFVEGKLFVPNRLIKPIAEF